MTTADGARETFSSVWGMILALLGVAIGLGNFWRFPYMMGIFGGGAFLAIYLVVVLLIGVPTLLAELSLGRATGRGPVEAFARAGLPAGRQLGMLLFLGVGMAMTYYLVVLGWLLAFLVRSAGWWMGWTDLPEHAFEQLHANVPAQLACSAVVGIAAGSVVSQGVRGGIERISRIFLPLFGSLTLGLAIWALTLPGAIEGVRYVFTFDPAALTPRGVMAAVGQAFFSLGLGGTFLVIYGSYMSPDTPLVTRALSTAGGDVAASLLGVMLIMPLAFVYGLSPASGPPLLFEVLPAAFRAMPSGAFFATLFFLGLGCIAFLSGVAAVEVIVGSLADRYGIPRARLVWFVIAALVVGGVPATLSLEYIVLSDLLWGSTMQPVGSVTAVVALTWGLGRERAVRELVHDGSAPRWAGLWFQWIRLAVPVVVLISLLSGWLG